MFFPFFQTIPAPIIDGDDESRLIPTFRYGLHRLDRVGASSCTETESKPRQFRALEREQTPQVVIFFRKRPERKSVKSGC